MDVRQLLIGYLPFGHQGLTQVLNGFCSAPACGWHGAECRAESKHVAMYVVAEGLKLLRRRQCRLQDISDPVCRHKTPKESMGGTLPNIASAAWKFKSVATAVLCIANGSRYLEALERQPGSRDQTYRVGGSGGRGMSS
jgi:hypothetical protein